MAAPKTPYTERIRLRVRPEVGEALDRLAESTRLSKSHLMRLAIERFLCDEMGVLAPADLPSTPTNQPRGATR